MIIALIFCLLPFETQTTTDVYMRCKYDVQFEQEELIDEIAQRYEFIYAEQYDCVEVRVRKIYRTQISYAFNWCDEMHREIIAPDGKKLAVFMINKHRNIRI